MKWFFRCSFHWRFDLNYSSWATSWWNTQQFDSIAWVPPRKKHLKKYTSAKSVQCLLPAIRWPRFPWKVSVNWQRMGLPGSSRQCTTRARRVRPDKAVPPPASPGPSTGPRPVSWSDLASWRCTAHCDSVGPSHSSPCTTTHFIILHYFTFSLK